MFESCLRNSERSPKPSDFFHFYADNKKKKYKSFEDLYFYQNE